MTGSLEDWLIGDPRKDQVTTGSDWKLVVHQSTKVDIEVDIEETSVQSAQTIMVILPKKI